MELDIAAVGGRWPGVDLAGITGKKLPTFAVLFDPPVCCAFSQF